MMMQLGIMDPCCRLILHMAACFKLRDGTTIAADKCVIGAQSTSGGA